MIKETTMSKFIKTGFVIYCLMLALQIIAQGYICYNDALHSEQYYTFWHFSEWLINYQGGFVRRGLCGEALLFIHRTFGADISLILYTVLYISTISLIILTVVIFRKNRLSMTILPTVILLGGFAMNIIPAYRRDALVLIAVFTTLYFYRQHIRNRKTIYYILFCTCSVFVILTHEASFFIFAPFILYHQHIGDVNSGHIGKLKKSFIFMMPAITAMGAVCLFKGNEDTANVIWNSYAQFFNEKFGHTPQIGLGVDALTWNSIETFRFHFATNYTEPIIKHTPRFFAWAIIFFFTFYLCANSNRVRIFKYEKEEACSTFLSEILIIQFISLLPMLTVLSCDLRRVTIYWTISSFFIYSLFNKHRIGFNKTYLTFIAERANAFFNKSSMLSNRFFFLLIAITIVCPFSGFALEAVCKSSIIGNITEILKRVMLFIA